MDWIHLHYQRAALCQTAEVTAWWEWLYLCLCRNAKKFMDNVKLRRGKKWREDSVVYVLQLLTVTGKNSALTSRAAQPLRQWHKPNFCLVWSKAQLERRHSSTCSYPSWASPGASPGRKVPLWMHSKSPKMHTMEMKSRRNSLFSVNENFMYNYLHNQNPIGFNGSLWICKCPLITFKICRYV